MDFFTGNDILDFLSELLYDLLHLADSDIISVIVRVIVVVMALALLVSLVKALFRILQDTFGGLVSWLWGIITAPYRIPRNALSNWNRKRQYRKLERKQNKEQKVLEAQRLKDEQERKQREDDAFRKIMEED